jgi:two-component system response regulator AtoC
MKKRLLIVDDEPSIRRVLQALLAREGYEVDLATDGAEAIDRLSEEQYHAVVTDLKMPHIGGLELLSWVVANDPGLPVIIITAHGTVDSAVEALKLGATDYITKPFDQDDLKRTIAKALRVEELNSLELKAESGRFDIIGRVPSMRKIFDLIEKVAASPTTVLITGESGTGKELVARALHDQSERASGPFIAVNCGAVPENLFESELFGHEKGAFTGASAQRKGRFELADGGTLFLDEVGELPTDLQVKLLRVLQDQRFERVGGQKAVEVSVRTVAATNRDLKAMVAEGRFRQDLYYRLNVIPIHLPPLRERAGDIPLLVEHFLARFNERLGREIVEVTDDARASMAAWHWPGNIRELENLMERAVLLAEGDTIDVGDLHGLADASRPRDEPADLEEMDLKAYVRVHTAKLERARILQALESVDFNVTRAARVLGISRKSLQTKMKDYGLREDPRAGRS